LFEPYKDQCHTITFDYGKEFAEHESIAAGLKVAVYFAHPYHTWERGLNENSNGILRKYFPKGMQPADLSDVQVQRAVDKLNHRPCEVLGYRTPHEIFFGVELRYPRQPLVVGLQS
jgi:IS30 family transposase